MKNAIKVFYHQQVILFHTNNLHSSCLHGITLEGQVIWEDIQDYIESDHTCLCIVDDNPADLFKQFCGFFTLIEAAGGLVLDRNGKLLFIRRYDKWDLPKGMIDQGETPNVAAIREVTEECGIPAPDILGHLDETFHIYQHENGKWILKKTSWFAMKGLSSWTVFPQTSEGITAVKWADAMQWEDMLRNSHGSIAELIGAMDIDYWLDKAGKI